ncbi:MAG: radical SAM protein [Magnetococcales bacterium]|nr:radical SAM protein [Magnetococcales bacterium]MBF0115930.1 radical SAM protein [Magnetococcales bacterium]
MAEFSNKEVSEIVSSFIKNNLQRGVAVAAICQALEAKGASPQAAKALVDSIASQYSEGTHRLGLVFDIVGDCNARCAWCVSGITGKGKVQKNFIDFNRFKQAIERLLAMDVLVAPPNRIITLYNWGEPLLHPRFYDILAFLNDHQFSINLSTNGSVPPKKVDPLLFSNVVYFGLSMPGFTQESYDRIHGFRMERILSNFDEWYQLLRQAHVSNRIFINFHLYKFTLRDDILKARDYFSRYPDVRFSPYAAYIADYTLVSQYLSGTMDADVLLKAEQELFLRPIADTVGKWDKDKKCPHIYNGLVLDESCNVVLCCAMSPSHPDYRIGSLFDLSLPEILREKANRQVCRECIELGVLYWHSNPYFLGDVKI